MLMNPGLFNTNSNEPNYMYLQLVFETDTGLRIKNIIYRLIQMFTFDLISINIII